MHFFTFPLTFNNLHFTLSKIQVDAFGLLRHGPLIFYNLYRKYDRNILKINFFLYRTSRDNRVILPSSLTP